MRNFNRNVLSAGDSLNTNGSQIDAGQVVSASFHAYFGDTNAAGTFKLQASNDVCNTNNLPNFIVTNWVDIPTQTATITAGASALLTIAQNAYKWLRCTYTNTAAGVQTFAPVADVAKSLAGKYILLSDGLNAHNYAFYFVVDGTGVAPSITGYTAAAVAIVTDDTAADVGAALAAAIAAINSTASFTASGTTLVTVTNKVAGQFTPGTAGNSGFTYALTVGGSSTINVNMNILSV